MGVFEKKKEVECVFEKKEANAVRVNSSSTAKWVMCVAHDSKLRCLLLLSDTCPCM